MPPIIPDIVIAISFAITAAVAGVAGFKYRDWTSASLVPGLLYLTIHFSLVRFVPQFVGDLWRTWGFLGFSLNILITVLWRYLYLIRGESWKK